MGAWPIAKKSVCALIAILSIVSAHASNDSEMALDIAKKNACLGCHAVSKKIVGPSYQDVALRYRNNPQAIAFLKNKIRNGGVGSWSSSTSASNGFTFVFVTNVNIDNVLILVFINVFRHIYLFDI